MNIIALDSSQEVLSIALETESGIYYTEMDAVQRHSELMMEGINYLVKLSGIKRDELELAACMKGPGSFTGLRIAYSTAKGLSLALGIPIKTVPTLDCLAFHLRELPFYVLPVMDAKQGRFYTAIYREGMLLTEYMDIDINSIKEELKKAGFTSREKIILTGSGASLLYSRLQLDNSIVDNQYRYGRARELLEIIKSGKIIDNEDVNSGPMYIRKSDAEIQRQLKKV